MGCSSADCSSAGSTLTYPDILQHNFTILHSNEVGFFAFKREQNYLQNDTKFIVICFVLPEIFYFKQKINTISVTAPSYLTYLFINCDPQQCTTLWSGALLTKFGSPWAFLRQIDPWMTFDPRWGRFENMPTNLVGPSPTPMPTQQCIKLWPGVLPTKFGDHRTLLSILTPDWPQLTPTWPSTPAMHYTLVRGSFHQIWWP